MERTYHGSCHCGAVRFEVALDLSKGTSRCNCSICSKTRYWKAFVPADAVRILQGAEVLTDYTFGEHVHHLFCSRCGVKPFGRVNLGERGTLCAVNVAALDDASDAELAAAPVAFQDGRHDAWERTPPVTSHL